MTRSGCDSRPRSQLHESRVISEDHTIEPQADVVAAELGFGVVLEGRAVMEDPAVVGDQHLAALERELDAGFGRATRRSQAVRR